MSLSWQSSFYVTLAQKTQTKHTEQLVVVSNTLPL